MRYPKALVLEIAEVIWACLNSGERFPYDSNLGAVYQEAARRALLAADVPATNTFTFGDKVRHVDNIDGEDRPEMVVLDSNPDDGVLVAWSNGDIHWIPAARLEPVDTDERTA